MKKNVVLTAAALVYAILFASCGSTKITLQEHSPVAILSICGNSQVPWLADNPNDPTEAESDGLLSTLTNKLIDGQNPEIVTALDRIDYADDSARQILPEITGCEILDKDEMINSEAYEDLQASYFNLLNSVKTATGYKDLTTIGTKEAKMAMAKLGVKSAVILNFQFQKKLVKGNKWNGELRGVVTMKAKVLKENGRELFNKTYTAETTEKIKISSHQYKKDKFVETLKEAIDNAIRQFATELAGDALSAVEVTENGEAVQGTAISLPARPAATTTEPVESADPIVEETESVKTAEPVVQ